MENNLRSFFVVFELPECFVLIDGHGLGKIGSHGNAK